MRMTRKLALVVTVVAALMGAAAPTALAATSAPAACGWIAPLGANYDGGAEYWLSYNTCNANVRGAVKAPNTVNYWHVWVYNENTGAEADAWLLLGGQVYTAAISDLSTYSHVCVQPYSNTNGLVSGPKACTSYY